MRHLLLTVCLLASSSIAWADAHKEKPPAKVEKTKSLYDRLGGKKAIEAVTKEFLATVGGDKRLNARFAKSDLKKLEKHLVDQICEATGGPCKYKGKSMAESHKGMKITEAEFTALVEDLVKALDKFKVPKTEKDELLGALGGMKGDIVGK
jgi:hemoglobin